MDLTLKKRYANHIFASQQPAFFSSHSQKDRHARTLFVAKEEALTKEEAFTASLINSSNTRTGNSLIITSTRKCDLVKKGIFHFHLRLDSLSFAICSSTGDMKRLIELYKVMMRNTGLSQTCKKHGWSVVLQIQDSYLVSNDIMEYNSTNLRLSEDIQGSRNNFIWERRRDLQALQTLLFFLISYMTLENYVLKP